MTSLHQSNELTNMPVERPDAPRGCGRKKGRQHGCDFFKRLVESKPSGGNLRKQFATYDRQLHYFSHRWAIDNNRQFQFADSLFFLCCSRYRSETRF